MSRKDPSHAKKKSTESGGDVERRRDVKSVHSAAHRGRGDGAPGRDVNASGSITRDATSAASLPPPSSSSSSTSSPTSPSPDSGRPLPRDAPRPSRLSLFSKRVRATPVSVTPPVAVALRPRVRDALAKKGGGAVATEAAGRSRVTHDRTRDESSNANDRRRASSTTKPVPPPPPTSAYKETRKSLGQPVAKTAGIELAVAQRLVRTAKLCDGALATELRHRFRDDIFEACVEMHMTPDDCEYMLSHAKMRNWSVDTKLIRAYQRAEPRRSRTAMIVVQSSGHTDVDATLRSDILTELVHCISEARPLGEREIAALWTRLVAPCFRHYTAERTRLVTERAAMMRQHQFGDDLRQWVRCMPANHRRAFQHFYRRRHGALRTKRVAPKDAWQHEISVEERDAAVQHGYSSEEIEGDYDSDRDDRGGGSDSDVDGVTRGSNDDGRSDRKKQRRRAKSDNDGGQDGEQDDDDDGAKERRSKKSETDDAIVAERVRLDPNAVKMYDFDHLSSAETDELWQRAAAITLRYTPTSWSAIACRDAAAAPEAEGGGGGGSGGGGGGNDDNPEDDWVATAAALFPLRDRKPSDDRRDTYGDERREDGENGDGDARSSARRSDDGAYDGDFSQDEELPIEGGDDDGEYLPPPVTQKRARKPRGATGRRDSCRAGGDGAADEEEREHEEGDGAGGGDGGSKPLLSDGAPAKPSIRGATSSPPPPPPLIGDNDDEPEEGEAQEEEEDGAWSFKEQADDPFAVLRPPPKTSLNADTRLRQEQARELMKRMRAKMCDLGPPPKQKSRARARTPRGSD